MLRRLLKKDRPRLDPLKGCPDCRTARKFLQCMADGELDQVEIELLQRHLDACRDCGLELEVYEALKSALGRLNAPDPESLQRLEKFVERLEAGEENAGS